jgi:Trypsin-like peptidase domain
LLKPIYKGFKMEPLSLILSIALSFFLGSLSASSKSNAQIAEWNIDKIYKVQVNGNTAATAFALKTKDGIKLVTAAHVCHTLIDLDADKFKKTALNHKNQSVELTEFNVSGDGDLCVMNKLPDNSPKFDLKKGDQKVEDAWLLGFPAGRELSVTSGMVVGEGSATMPMEIPLDRCSGSAYKVFGPFCIFNAKTTDTTVSAAPGNSGGPLIDKNNKVIGVASYIDTRTAGYVSTVPLSVIQKFVNE